MSGYFTIGAKAAFITGLSEGLSEQLKKRMMYSSSKELLEGVVKILDKINMEAEEIIEIAEKEK